MTSDSPFEPPSAPPPRSFAPPPMPGLERPVGSELASWGRRAGGFAIDFVISLVIQTIVAAGTDIDTGRAAGFIVGIVFVYMQGKTGQTPGKQATNIRLLREQDGSTIGFGTSLVRQIVHIVDLLPLLIGFLWPLWDDKKQTFADKIMGTIVVKA